MQKDGDNLLLYLRGVLETKGVNKGCIDEIIDDIRLNYGGGSVYILKNDQKLKEKIKEEYKTTRNVSKIARKYRKSRNFVYKYLNN